MIHNNRLQQWILNNAEQVLRGQSKDKMFQHISKRCHNCWSDEWGSFQMVNKERIIPSVSVICCYVTNHSKVSDIKWELLYHVHGLWIRNSDRAQADGWMILHNVQGLNWEDASGWEWAKQLEGGVIWRLLICVYGTWAGMT